MNINNPLDPQIFYDIYEMPPLKWYSNPWNIVGALLVGLMIVAMGLAAWYWYKRYYQVAWRKALRDIAFLEQNIQSDLFYIRLSALLRTYCSRGNLCTNDVTDGELFNRMLEIIPDYTGSLADTIERFKQCKFAQCSPKHEIKLSDLTHIKLFIEQTKYI